MQAGPTGDAKVSRKNFKEKQDISITSNFPKKIFINYCDGSDRGCKFSKFFETPPSP